MKYRTEVVTLEGFVQQLAANILPHGYWFYVMGRVPDGKNPRVIDENLLAKYGIAISRQQRARRKQADLANIHYLRFGRIWIMLATHGRHHWFQEHTRVVIDTRTKKEKEVSLFRDARRDPIQIGGYSITVKQGNFLKKDSAAKAATDSKRRTRVQIAREKYRELTSYFLELATRRTAEELGREFYKVPFEPYAPIRKQLLNVLRLVNAKRQEAGLTKVPLTVIRYRRRIVLPYGEPLDAAA